MSAAVLVLYRSPAGRYHLRRTCSGNGQSARTVKVSVPLDHVDGLERDRMCRCARDAFDAALAAAADATVSRPAGPTMPRPFRIPDPEYLPALAAARARGETLTDVVRRALRAYTAAHVAAADTAAQGVEARDAGEACPDCLETFGRTCRACHDEDLAQDRDERAAEARAEAREDTP